jgi:hypothetical protein
VPYLSGVEESPEKDLKHPAPLKGRGWRFECQRIGR